MSSGLEEDFRLDWDMGRVSVHTPILCWATPLQNPVLLAHVYEKWLALSPRVA